MLLLNAKPNAPSPLVTPIVPKRSAMVPVFVIVTVCVVVVPTTCVPKLRSKLILTAGKQLPRPAARPAATTPPPAARSFVSRVPPPSGIGTESVRTVALQSQRRAADAAHLSRIDLAPDELDLGLWARQRTTSPG